MVERFNALKEAGVPQEMAFPRSEYDARVAKVRKAMEEQGIDVLLVQYTPNFCYLAGYQTPLAFWYGCLVLPREGEPTALVPQQEIDNLMVHGWNNENIHLFDWQNNREAPAEVARVLQDQGFAEKTLGLEEALPGWGAYTAKQLQALLPRAHIKDASDLVLNFRAVKSPAEMAHVREAARLTDIGMQAGLDAIAPGKTDDDVAGAAYMAMVHAGSEYVSIQPLVYTGHVTGMLHVMQKRRVIKQSDVVGIELAGVYHRYSAPLVRPAVIGQPSDTVKRLEDYAQTTLALIGENVKPGRRASDVARAVTQNAKPLDPQAGRNQRRWGYSVGIGFPPDWVEHSFMIDDEYDRPLEEGMVFHTPIGPRLFGKVGVSISEFWAVTATGCEPLSKLPRELTVVSA